MRVRWPFEKFDSTVCKANLKMAISRARMCTNRLQNSIRLQRKDIAAFLTEGREEGARLKAEHLLREYRLERAMEILVTVCELLISRMSYLATEKMCPPDLLSPIHTLLYCEPRLSIDELAAVRKQFGVKYGDAFVDSALKNAKQEVHFKLVHALSLAPPLEVDLQQLLCGIAKEYLVSGWKSSIAIETSHACEFIPRPGVPSRALGSPFSRAPSFPEVPRGDADTAIRERSCTAREGITYSVEEYSHPFTSVISPTISASCIASLPQRDKHPWIIHAVKNSINTNSTNTGNLKCFPDLQPPPHPHWPHADIPIAEASLLSGNIRRDQLLSTVGTAVTLECTNSYEDEDCATTPFHHEIPIGAWHSPATVVPSPASEQAFCQLGNSYEEVKEKREFQSRDEIMSSLSMSPDYEGGGSDQQQMNSCSTLMPVAAMPAYYLA